MIDYIENRYSKKQIYIVLVSVLIFLNLLLTLLVRYNLESFKLNGDTFKKVKIEGNTIYFKDKTNKKLKINGNYNEELGFNFDGKYILEYKEKTIIYENELDKNIITLSDGSKYTDNLIDFSQDNNPYEIQLIYKAIDTYKNIKYLQGNTFSTLIFSMIFSFSGLFLLMYPEKAWKIQHFLDVEGGCPTNFAIKSNKFGGVAMCIISVVAVLSLLSIK